MRAFRRKNADGDCGWGFLEGGEYLVYRAPAIAQMARRGHTLAGPNRVRLRDVRGCAEADVVLMPDGRIRGRVVLAHGAAASHVFVEAVAEEDLAHPGLSRWSD